MKIYSMTATFGKLEHETLTMNPGLNVIQAPNEWGKSTWCAFLVAMLYGMETRAHSTKSALSDKEHYAPWSGAPMSGSIDLCWQGRDITIQRKTKGRSVFGDFKAFETHTGLPVPELTAANCGTVLLGVEKSVFSRSAFIRLTDLPVTQDEALRHRLNSLVTTGDDSGTAEALEKKLRDLRNRCRYNRTGLLPQAEAEAAELERKLGELDSLHRQAQSLRQQQGELERHHAALENHRVALAYAKSREDALHVIQARNAEHQSERKLQELEAACAGQPAPVQLKENLSELGQIQAQWAALQTQSMPAVPEKPEIPTPFRGMTTQEAKARLARDGDAYVRHSSGRPLLWLIPGLLLVAAAVALLLLTEYVAAAWAVLAVGMVLTALGPVLLAMGNTKAKAIQAHYGGGTPGDWEQNLMDYVNREKAYSQAKAICDAADHSRRAALEQLKQRLDALCGSLPPARRQEYWLEALERWEDLEDARQALIQAKLHTAALEAMADEAPPPAAPDSLTFSDGETARLLTETAVQLQYVHNRLGQCMGQMESVGQQTVLEARLEVVRQRIGQLEDTYAAATLALENLQQARTELQRRFAPKITQHAQLIMDRLTGGRYDRLLLDQDLNLHAAAQSEDTMRTTLWRSDGTVDQLYLALRLAVADALLPGAPLVLDDALVRFDDQRLRSAMEVLQEEAKDRQVILFTCQSRELSYL